MGIPGSVTGGRDVWVEVVGQHLRLLVECRLRVLTSFLQMGLLVEPQRKTCGPAGCSGEGQLAGGGGHGEGTVGRRSFPLSCGGREWYVGTVLGYLFKCPSFFLFISNQQHSLVLLLPSPLSPSPSLFFSSVPLFIFLGSFILFLFIFNFVFPLHSRKPFLDHQVFIYVNNCRPAPCGGRPAMTSVHLPPQHSPTSPTP